MVIMKKYKLIFIILLCIAFSSSITCGELYYYSQKKLQALEKEMNDTIEDFYFPGTPLYGYIKDSNFKLFWGKWKVTKVMGEHVFDERAFEWYTSFDTDNEAEKLIGTVYEFTDSNISIDTEIIAEKIMYKYYVIPKKNFSSKDMFLMEYSAPEDFGLNGNFFLLVEAISKEQKYFCTEFYVKDNDTLILISDNIYYEMKRA